MTSPSTAQNGAWIGKVIALAVAVGMAVAGYMLLSAPGPAVRPAPHRDNALPAKPLPAAPQPAAAAPRPTAKPAERPAPPAAAVSVPADKAAPETPAEPRPAARKEEAAEAPRAPKEEQYPGVAALPLSTSVTKADRADFDRLTAATRFAVQKNAWREHLDAIDAAILAAAGSGVKSRAASNFERILSQPLPSLMLAQSMAIHAFGTDRLGRICGKVETVAFMEWLFVNTQALQQLVATVKPADNLERAVDIWRDIWTEDIPGRQTFMNLAIAIALVFDEPVKINMAVYGAEAGTAGYAAADRFPSEVSALERYRFYRESASKGVFKTDMAELAPYELVWVVDAPVPTSELVWALKRVSLSRKSWERAYSMVRYRMDKAAGKGDIYKKYTLEEILKEGGICGDQAYFAAVTAKAHGIPAMVIAGVGERGGHAWFGYKATAKEWNLEAGRYTSDNYVAGTSTDPQTRAPVKEHELKILADPQRRSPAWQTSERLAQLASLLGTNSALTQLALETALQESPRYFDGWLRLLAFRVTQKPGPAEWQRELQRARTTFKDYPDLVEKLNAVEIDYLAASGNAELARKAADRQTRRLENKSGARSDLINDSLDREVSLADSAGDKDKARRLYRRAISDANGSIVKFNALAPRYFAWGQRNALAAEVAHDIQKSFGDIPLPAGDLFATQSYLSALRTLISEFEQAGLTAEAGRLKRKAAKIEENLQDTKQFYGGNQAN